MPETDQLPTKPVLGKDITADHTLVGESGNPSVVDEDARSSSAMPGLVFVETEHVPLYLDPYHDHDYLVLDE